MTIKTRVDFSGPFFRGDPGAKFLGNVRKMMQGIAAEGEAAARQNLRAGQAGRAPITYLGDRVADHVVGRVKSVTGKQWTAAAVVSINNSGLGAREGKALMAAASQVERQTRAFSALTRDLRNARAVLRANLAEGLD